MLFKITENYPEKCFSIKEKEAWLNLNLGQVLIALLTIGPWRS